VDTQADLGPDLPRYRDLPIAPGVAARTAWGVFGDDDQVGTLNLLTPDRVRRARDLIVLGQVYPLNLNLELPNPPLSGRGALKHSIAVSQLGSEDWYDNFYPQASSQWDGLAHCGHPTLGFYNGHQAAQITGRAGSTLGMENWASRGITGRFVLADVDRHRTALGRPLDHASSDVITIDDLEAALAAARVTLELGDILLMRTGWLTWYKGTDQPTRDALAAKLDYATPGLECTEAAAEWLWDHHVAAIVADNPGVEVVPVVQDDVATFLHFRLIPLLGMALGELFDLDGIAAACAASGVYEGFFAAAPLHVTGGSASTGNALAIL
jgi:kynurenine formamidase